MDANDAADRKKLGPNPLKDNVSELVAVTSEVVKTNEEANMIPALIGSTIAALLIGTLIGAMCIYCIGKSYKKNQQTRHSATLAQGSDKKFTTASSVTLDGTNTGVQNQGGAIPTSPDILSKVQRMGSEDLEVQNVQEAEEDFKETV